MNIKRNIIRTAAAALSTGLLFAATATQAADINNREIGHFADAQSESVNLQGLGLAAGLQNGQVGHFAAKIGNVDAGSTSFVYGDTEHSLR